MHSEFDSGCFLQPGLDRQATKHNVTFSYSLDCARRRQIFRDDLEFSREPHRGYGSRHDFNLGTFKVGVFARCIQNSIQVVFFNPVWIDKHQPSYSETGELLNNRATGSGTSNHGDRHFAEPQRGPLTEELGMSLRE